MIFVTGLSLSTCCLYMSKVRNWQCFVYKWHADFGSSYPTLSWFLVVMVSNLKLVGRIETNWQNESSCERSGTRIHRGWISAGISAIHLVTRKAVSVLVEVSMKEILLNQVIKIPLELLITMKKTGHIQFNFLENHSKLGWLDQEERGHFRQDNFSLNFV